MTSVSALQRKEITRLGLKSFRFQKEFEEIKGVFQSFDAQQRKFVLEELRKLAGENGKKPFVSEDLDPKFAELRKNFQRDVPGLAAGLPDTFVPDKSDFVPDFEDVLQAVSRVSGVSTFDLKGPIRAPRISYPRSMAIYLMMENCDGASYPQIAHFMMKHHTSCIAAHKRFPERLLNHKWLKRVYDQVCRDLELV